MWAKLSLLGMHVEGKKKQLKNGAKIPGKLVIMDWITVLFMHNGTPFSQVLVGVKFLCHWPFLGCLRGCFVGPPYFQMTVKLILTYGIDATELPGIAGWLDNLMALAFEQRAYFRVKSLHVLKTNFSLSWSTYFSPLMQHMRIGEHNNSGLCNLFC